MAESKQTVDIAELTKMCGAPDHEQQTVQAFSGDGSGTKWTKSEARDIAAAWRSGLSDKD